MPKQDNKVAWKVSELEKKFLSLEGEAEVMRREGGLKKLLISAYDKTDRLREMRTRGREGGKNPENFVYLLNGSPLRILTNFCNCDQF